MSNLLTDVRTTLTEKGLDAETIENLVSDIEFSMMEQFKFTRIKENLTKKLFPLIDAEKSIYTGNGTTNNLINANNLNALDVLNRIGKKSDVVFMDMTPERIIFNDAEVTIADHDRESKWFTYIETRAKYIKKIMSNESMFFVSVDDRFLAETKLILDKVFNKKNFVANMIWKKPDNSIHNDFLNRTKEYVLVYKSIGLNQLNRKENETGGKQKKFNKLDRTRRYRAVADYAIPVPNTEGEFAYAGGSKEAWENRQKGIHNEFDWRWMLDEVAFYERLEEGYISFKQGSDGQWKVYNVFTAGNPMPFDDVVDAPTYRKGKFEVEDMFQRMSKRNNKPTDYFKYLINLHPNENVHILDINGENASVGQAVLEMNCEDGGFRTFTLISDEKHDGYIEYFAYERMRKQIKGYTRIKDKEEIEGKGSNLNVYTLVEKETDIEGDIFNSIVKLVNNTIDLKIVTETLHQYKDGIGNSVFILEDTIVDNKELKDTLKTKMDLKRENSVYIPFKLRSPELSKELLSIGMDNPKYKELTLRV